MASSPSKPAPLFVTGDADADRYLNTDPLALLIGMLLDQQIPMEWAFIGPYRLRERMGGTLDAATVASMDPEAFVALVKGPPALHRFPGSMGKRIQDLCAYLVEHHDGRAENVWLGVATGRELLARLKALPGYGDEKARIFVALLAKRMGVAPDGWREAAGPFGDDTPRSVADIHDAESLARVREWKKARKAAGRSKAD
jgi:uncharacterized HhH-GPD family protein